MTAVIGAAPDMTAQSLASGAAGMALLDIERALAGTGDWASAAGTIQAAAASDIDGGDRASLYYGVPAIRFVLHAAQADGNSRYSGASRALDRHVTEITSRLIAAATESIRHSGAATFRDYDLFCGLTGLAALLLRTTPGSDALGRALAYLIGLTQPRRDREGTVLPGWWVAHDPDPALPTPGGHANLGMAHGAAGILALLAVARLRGIEVPGQIEAIDRLGAVFASWRQQDADGTWWPQWITRADLRAVRPERRQPGRNSWCYGTAGIARALQLAGLATADLARQRQAENDLATSLTDLHLRWITEPGLCHGMAGIYQTTWRAAHNATTPALSRRLPALAAQLACHAAADENQDRGLLTGRAGIDLALQTACNGAPRSGWDACLLIT